MTGGGGELKGLGERPLIMGILNITPDSFSDGGRFIDPKAAIHHAVYMADAGADIIDIGGESSRPGSGGVTLEEELSRVIPVIKEVCCRVGIPISIDTTKYEVARQALDVGAAIINDISALRTDERIGRLAAEGGAHLVLMHMRGVPRTMQHSTQYDDLVGEISAFLKEAADKAVGMGVARDKIIIDPGIGFGKSVEGNFVILKNLHRFLALGYPILVGASRKSFIGKTLSLDEAVRLEGSLAAACYAVLNGAAIVRVHDVLETKRALTVIEKITAAPDAPLPRNRA
jgi:dihydropteroate synthase